MGSPLDVAVASDGRVYVRGVTAAKITMFDAEGNVLGGWGHPGSGEGQFEFGDPTDEALASFGGMAIVNDVIFVADKSRVQMFDLDGKYLGAWGSRGRKPGQFLKVMHMAAGPDGNIYLVDANLNNVQSFTPEGKLVARRSIPVKDMGRATVLCVTPASELILAYERGDRPEGEPAVVLYKVSSAGKLLTSWSGAFEGTAGAACSADGRVYVGDDGGSMYVFDTQGKPLFSFSGPTGSEPNGAVAVSGNNVVVTDTDAGTVSKFHLNR